MSNTLIQIKRSTVTAVPPNGSLDDGELAYSYNSDKLFIGNSSGTGIVEIGGRFYVDLTIAAFDAANNAAGNANAIGASVNSYVQAVGAAGNAYALATATSIGTAGNNYTISVGTAGNNYTLAIGAAGNAYALDTATSVGTAGNNYTNAVGSSGNAYALDTATSVGTAGNNYTNAVGAAGNNYTNAVGTAGNNYTDAVSTAGNNYTNSTFVKLVSPNQTITGNLAVTGSLTVSGNAYTIDTETLRISDPLIYLAGNNYASDIVDIGFIANYNDGSANLHTGFFREHTNKEYYLFEGYTEEPFNNHIDISGNNFTIAVLNASLKSNNIILNGTNTANWITSAFDKANAVATSANSYASVIGDAANAYAQLVGAAGNNYTNAVGTAGNNYTNAVGAAGNAYALATATSIGTAGNNYTDAVGAAGNTYTGLAFDKANSAVQTGFVTIVAGGNSLVADSNNDTLTINGANGVSIIGDAGTDTMSIGLSATGVTIGTYGGPSSIGVFTVNEFGRITAATNSSISIDASAISTGILTVQHGGTGVNTFTENGILFGNTTGALKVTSAGTEGQVLQASSTGVPQFGMLDGGTF